MKNKSLLMPFSIILAFVVVLTIIRYIIPGWEQLSTLAYAREFILSFGHLASIAYVTILSLTIPLPSPSTPLILAGGFMFGTIKGFLLAMIGEIIGATIAFYLIRFAGRPLLYKLAKESVIHKLDNFFKKKGLIAALISYAVPIFPSDVISLFMGLTKVRYPLFLFLVIIGHIPRLFIINYLGSDLYTGITIKTMGVFLIGILFVLAVFFRDEVIHSVSSKAKESTKKVAKKIRIVKGNVNVHRKIRIPKR